MVEDNEFFRNATLRICGSLDIEEALHTTLLYIRDFVPADIAFLWYFDPGLGAGRTIARADASGGHRLDMITPLSELERDDHYLKDAFPVGRAVIQNRPANNPLLTTMSRFHGYDEGSVSILAMMLLSGDAFHGGIVFVADELDRYSDRHAHLVSLLAEPFTIAMMNYLQHRELMLLRDRLTDDNLYLHRELLRTTGDEIVGADFGLRETMQKVRQVAPTESPVLLTGETGVGKDLLAGAIHLRSSRRDGPFIPVNCGAIPESLIDSELFGHEKGAFTGALSTKRGRFERADTGTILLDEIGEMPLLAQTRLLRVLQHREIERVGGTERIPIDIRIIAASNQDLAKMVQAGRFREDLWFRLNVFPIAVPSLRDRLSDMPALVNYFIERKAKDLKIGDTPRLAPGAMDVLAAYDWPGNVRELENVVERAMILNRDEPIRFEDLGTSLPRQTTPKASENGDQPLELDTVITQHIKRVLGMSGGKIHGPGGAGELLAVNPNTLRYKMRKLGIPFRKRSGG